MSIDKLDFRSVKFLDLRGGKTASQFSFKELL